ncbi:Transposable element tcb2 transposase, partial [Caligus rogercresseyi]
MCPPPASTTVSTRDLNALTDLDTSAASKDMATDNDRWICREASEVPMVFRTKNPAAVMVLGVISSEGHVMPPHFFEPKQKVNQEVYLEPWIDTVASGRKYTFQQDSAPAHKAKTVQAWLKEN